MEDSKYTMEYDTPTLLAPKYRYAIARGASGDGIDGGNTDLDPDKVSGGL